MLNYNLAGHEQTTAFRYMKELCFLLGCLFWISVCGQNKLPDSAWLATSVAKFESCYKEKVGAKLALYNGPLYGTYIPKTVGHPYFLADTMLNGRILFNGELYPDIKLKYDLTTSRLVMHNFRDDFLFSPGLEKIKFFTVGKHYFESLSVPVFKEAIPAAGFYENIFSGKHVSVYVKWEKKLFQPIKVEDTLPFYKEYRTWYIYNGGFLYEISGKRTVIKALDDKKQLMKTFIAAKNIDDITSESLILIASHYESLKK